MQTIRKAPPRTGGVGTTLSLLLLGVLLTLAALMFCLNHLRADIESDLSYRVGEALSGTGVNADNISVEGLDVTLSGNIETEVARDGMADLAASVFGVGRVFNDLTVTSNETSGKNDAEQSLAVEPSTDRPKSAGQSEADNATETVAELVVEPVSEPKPEKQPVVEAKPQPRSSSNKPVAASTLQLIVTNGKVNVQGIVPDVETVERINAAVAGKFGQANVEDDMSTYVGSAEPVWIDGAISLIDQMDDVIDPSIKITEDEVILGGQISSETLGEQKLALANRLLGIYLPVSSEFKMIDKNATLPAPEITPRTIVKRPPSLKIRSINNTVTLTGTISTFEDAQIVRNAMIGVFGQGTYSDELIIDDSVASADWFEDSIKVTDSIKSIDDFGVSINSGQLLLSGNISDRETGRSLRAVASDLLGDRLAVINNFSLTQSGSLAESAEELFARELMQELDSLKTEAIVFNRNSATLTEGAKSVLDQVAQIIQSYEGQVVEIAGHTDSTGDSLVNLELSKKRADAVHRYLIDKQIPTDQLRPIGYGETIPIADNSTPEGRAANRRIEFNL